MFHRSSFCRKAFAIVLMVAVSTVQIALTVPASAQDAQSGPVSGELSLNGSVSLNGNPAAPGDTVINDSVLRTDCNATAAVNFGKLGRVELGPGSEMVLVLTGTVIGGTLRTGSATISTPAGVAVSLATAEGIVTTSGTEVAVLTVDLTLGNTRVMPKRSDAKLTAGSKVEYVSAGQEAAVGTQNPGQGTRCARLAGVGGVATTGGVPAAMSAGALTALIIAGVGGAVAGIVAASQADSTSPGQIFVSTFAP